MAVRGGKHRIHLFLHPDQKFQNYVFNHHDLMLIMLIHKCKYLERYFPIIYLHQNFSSVNYFQFLKLQIPGIVLMAGDWGGAALYQRGPQM